ncbi:MAG TPA: alpha-ketoacid dehydrogenase subunit beta [Candidatus Solibacter sp.]|jgi:pyruvate dehydrogenase E1 component beta subunit|nr:alpha-ketoacid dehydrogenase subunit beta [Candidatus Solibacter sp.]
MSEMTYREGLRQALKEKMEGDPRVFILGEDVGAYGGAYSVTRGLQEEFGPERVRETPIAESAIIGCAIGAAMGGMRPVAEIMTINFALLAMDQIVNHAAKFHYMFGGKIRVPMVMRTVSGWGQLGATHSQTFENWFSSVPGLKVVAPATPRDAKGLLKASIEDDDPVIFIEHSLLYGIKGEVPDNDFRETLGRALVVREGTDVTIVGYSRMLQVALRAAAQLEEQGVSAEVIDLRTLRPLDMDTVYESVRKTHRLVMCEEDWRTVGIGAEIAASVSEQCFDALDAPVRRVAMPDVPMPYAKNLELALVPTEEEVVAATRSVMD